MPVFVSLFIKSIIRKVTIMTLNTICYSLHPKMIVLIFTFDKVKARSPLSEYSRYMTLKIKTHQLLRNILGSCGV